MTKVKLSESLWRTQMLSTCTRTWEKLWVSVIIAMAKSVNLIKNSLTGGFVKCIMHVFLDNFVLPFAVVYLTHLDYQDTERIMTEKLQNQVNGTEWSWKNLNTVCLWWKSCCCLRFLLFVDYGTICQLFTSYKYTINCTDKFLRNSSKIHRKKGDEGPRPNSSVAVEILFINDNLFLDIFISNQSFAWPW